MAEIPTHCEVCKLPIEMILRIDDETGQPSIVTKHMLDSYPLAERDEIKRRSAEAHAAKFIAADGRVRQMSVDDMRIRSKPDADTSINGPNDQERDS